MNDSTLSARRRWSRRGLVVATALFVSACGANARATDSADATLGTTAAATGSTATDGGASGAPKFTVVVSDPPLADLVQRVAGDQVEVTSLVPMGADGHTYEPKPEDARTLARANVYIENGMGLNDVVSNFASSNYRAGTPHHRLSEVIPEAEVIATDSEEEIKAHGHAHSFNAHFWPDPVYAMAYVKRIERILSEFDALDAPGYASRSAAFTAELQRLDDAFRTALATIPAANRKLVVYHDSWSYYARRYGLQVVGAIQPTDFSEPSAAELRTMIEEVRRAGVPAFFGSEVFPSDVLAVIEEETDAKYVADLSDDRLPGAAGTPEHSYVGMMVANTRTIVTALGGTATALDTVDPARR
jgi:ABC-type Zn uptake system ZnuABC Zn-binding protein ZnuA